MCAKLEIKGAKIVLKARCKRERKDSHGKLTLRTRHGMENNPDGNLKL